jgi:DNA-binding transcriptional LysR family regulator
VPARLSGRGRDDRLGFGARPPPCDSAETPGQLVRVRNLLGAIIGRSGFSECAAPWASNCVMPRIARFVSRFPDIELVARLVETVEEIGKLDFDVAVMAGWPPKAEFVVRTLAQTRHIVCASPEDWMREGQLDEPEALRNHHCLVFRGGAGTLLDRWSFEKNGERRTVDVTGRLQIDHGSWLDEAVCAGAGVIRVPDLIAARYLSSGLLVPALTDWEALESPTIYALYRRAQRQSTLVRAFLDFLVEVFTEIDAERPLPPGSSVRRIAKPEWFGRTHGRQSAYVARRRKTAS